MGKIKKLKSYLAIGYHFLKSLTRQARFERSNSSYFILTAHPDDEILVSGLLQRLAETESDHTFLCLSNGSVNHSGDVRIKELSDALGFVGYDKHLRENSPLTVADEKEIYGAIRGDGDLGKLVLGMVDKVTEQIKIAQPDYILVPDFSGGHLVHDLAQLVGVVAARRYKESGNYCEVHEFPQCILVGGEKYTDEELTAEIGRLRKKDTELSQEKNKKPLDIKIVVGDFHPSKMRLPGLRDPQLGIFSGRLRLSVGEFWNKVKHYTCFYESQGDSLGKYEEAHVLGNVSQEEFRRVPDHRDFNEKPLEKIFYQHCKWRKLKFEDFQRIVELSGYKPAVAQPHYPITPASDVASR